MILTASLLAILLALLIIGTRKKQVDVEARIQGQATRLHAREFRIASTKQNPNTFQLTTKGCTATELLVPECIGQMGMLFVLHSLS